MQNKSDLNNEVLISTESTKNIHHKDKAGSQIPPQIVLLAMTQQLCFRFTSQETLNVTVAHQRYEIVLIRERHPDHQQCWHQFIYMSRHLNGDYTSEYDHHNRQGLTPRLPQPSSHRVLLPIFQGKKRAKKMKSVL